MANFIKLQRVSSGKETFFNVDHIVFYCAGDKNTGSHLYLSKNLANNSLYTSVAESPEEITRLIDQSKGK